jgi:hypothetical protein
MEKSGAMIRDHVRRLITDLGSGDAATVQPAPLTASLALEQTHLLQSVQAALADPILKLATPPDYATRRLKGIRADLAHYHAIGLLPAEFVDLHLTDDEIDAICHALINLLEGPPEQAGSAACALSACDRPCAIVPLARAVRPLAPADKGGAVQAIRALGRVLIASRGRVAEKPLDAARQEVVAALRFAAERAPAGTLVQDAAGEELLRLTVALAKT